MNEVASLQIILEYLLCSTEFLAVGMFLNFLPGDRFFLFCLSVFIREKFISFKYDFEDEKKHFIKFIVFFTVIFINLSFKNNKIYNK